ncbi:hypothetical protein LPJ73_008644, partial [Coemansia sp. RSA 2703]
TGLNSGDSTPFPGTHGSYTNFPSQGGADVYPPLSQAPYPPAAGENAQAPSFGQAPYPPAAEDAAKKYTFGQAPYPPPAGPPPQTESSGPGPGTDATVAVAAAAAAAGAAAATATAANRQQSTGSELHTLAPSEVPPGVPLPIGQENITPEDASGAKKHVTTAVAGGSSKSSGKPMAFLNIADSETVHQRFLIVSGRVSDVKGDDDKIVVHHPYFPPLTFPAVDGYFKALVELERGENGLRFDYLQGGERISQAQLTVMMEPYTDRPALQLAVLVGSDSQGIFDAPPDARGPGLNDLDAAVRKFRCCAYLWQAYVAEQLYRAGFGRRTFRLDETYASDTMARDGAQRMTARVHTVRMGRT